MVREQLLVFVCAIATLASCICAASEESVSPYSWLTDQEIEARYLEYENSFIELIRDVSMSLDLREDAKVLFHSLDRKLSSGEPIRSDDQRSILQEFSKYRDNRDKFEQLIKNYEFYSDESRVLEIRLSESSGIEPKSSTGWSEKEIVVNPEDKLGRLIIAEVKMWLAAKLMIIDNYAVVILRYRQNDDFRRQFDLDTIDPEIEEFLEQVTDEVLDDDKYERLNRVINFVKKVHEYELDNTDGALAHDKDNRYLNELIQNSYAYSRIPQMGLADELRLQSNEYQDELFDGLIWMGNEAVFQASKYFGNTIGLVETREGKMSDMSRARQREITGELSPLDILLEKTPFRLTDSFIPGHWGHVAVWVGDKRAIPELKRLGVWDELPGLEARARKEYKYEGMGFQESIEQNRGVLEALRPGVELNSFAHFLNIDDLAVIRAHTLRDEDKRTYLLNAFKQVGKAYDFNFNVETHAEIVCSELAFVVFDDFEWPVQNSVGRYTVSPDHVAGMALGGQAVFDPILIYHDGKKLPSQNLQENLNALLHENYDDVTYSK